MNTKALLTLGGLLLGSHASALQPLEVFLRGARTSGTDIVEARAARRQLGAEADAALGRALPGVSLRGTYTRNELETVVPGAGTLTPLEQLDGTATLAVPLVDLASFARISAARTRARASAEQEASTDLEVQSLVTRSYYQLVADVALVEAARRALDVSRESLRIAEVRHAAGTAALLDVHRASAEVERNVQQLASAELRVTLLARALRSLTSLEPELEGEVRLADDLREPPPLERFQAPDEELPSVAAAIRSRVASEQQARGAWLSLVPSLGASVTERLTDAAGFGARDASWQAVAALTWSFDLTTVASIRVQEAAAAGARAREERARLAARDGIHGAWATVRTNIARSRSARAQAKVSADAAELALDRYQAGAGTQIDVLQAQRDAFGAEAARIQADADLVDSRAQLELAAGRALLEDPA